MRIRQLIRHVWATERGSNVAQATAVAMVAAALIGALVFFAPQLGAAVETQYRCLVGALNGAGGDCLGQAGSAPATGQQAFVPAPEPADDGDDCSFLCQLGGVAKGFGEGLVDTVTGIGTLAVDAVKYAAGDEATRAKYAALVQAFRDDPWGTTKALAEAMVEPMVTDWREGRYGEAIGRGIFEAISTIGGPKGVHNLGRLSRVDDLARVAGRADELGDAGRVVRRLPCAGAAPAGKAPGLAKPLLQCRIGDNVTRLPDDMIEAPPKRGDAPISVQDGNPVEVHHVDQNPDGPFIELSRHDHRGPGNFSRNHSNTGQQPSRIDRREWRRMVDQYWREEWDRGRFRRLLLDRNPNVSARGW